MRVLTVRQPWAWAIIHGGKDVENRSRNIAGTYRGPVAIHVALARAEIDEQWNWRICAEVGRLSRAGLPGNKPVPARISDPDEQRHHVHPRYGNRGAIIGVVDLVDVHHVDDCRGETDDAPDAACSRWAMGGHWHLGLGRPRAIEPVPARGRLGLWRPDSDLHVALNRGGA